MRLQIDAPKMAFSGNLRSPLCPRCGETIFAAAATAFVRDGLIRHTWACDSCEHQFRTIVEVPAWEV